jgi:hypothetical protein
LPISAWNARGAQVASTCAWPVRPPARRTQT